MLRRDSAAAIGDGDFGMRGACCNRELNCAAVGCETQRVINQVAYGATKQNRITINFAFAGAIDRDMSVLRDRSIKRRALFQRRAPIKLSPLDWFAGRVNPSDEEQIVNDPGEPFAFGNRGLDYFAIFLRAALAR